MGMQLQRPPGGVLISSAQRQRTRCYSGPTTPAGIGIMWEPGGDEVGFLCEGSVLATPQWPPAGPAS